MWTLYSLFSSFFYHFDVIPLTGWHKEIQKIEIIEIDFHILHYLKYYLIMCTIF